jgi:hypothetical protein
MCLIFDRTDEDVGISPPKGNKSTQTFIFFTSLLCQFITISSLITTMAATCRVVYEVHGNIPDVLLPIRRIKCLGEKNYTDLSEHPFTAKEKIFLCQDVQRSRDGLGTMLDPTDSISGFNVVTLSGLACRYNLKLSTCQWWYKKFVSGELFSDA